MVKSCDLHNGPFRAIFGGHDLIHRAFYPVCRSNQKTQHPFVVFEYDSELLGFHC